MSIENEYQKKSLLEHILLRPDTYIGTVEKVCEEKWIFDEDLDCMVQKKLEYTPGLYKIFDEILVNAVDNKERDPAMDCIRISIDQEANEISVWNNGKGLPVQLDKERNTYTPTLIFGQLFTSTNYNDEEERFTGGRNGCGAKLCNIFSKKFTVETASKDDKRKFHQTWTENMSKSHEPLIQHSTENYTKITFKPDLKRFKMSHLEDDTVLIMKRRAYDVAATIPGVSVFLNGVQLPVRGFKDYIGLYTRQNYDILGYPLRVAHADCGAGWEVGVACSTDGSFQQVSFVNGVATTRGGRHVDYVADLVARKFIGAIDGHDAMLNEVKNHMWLFVNCRIVNPTFNSQTKEEMVKQVRDFGSQCRIPEQFLRQMVKCGIIEAVVGWPEVEEQERVRCNA